MKLNLCCGDKYLEGYINADIARNVKTDERFDADKEMPFSNETFKEVLLNQGLEHLTNVGFALGEINRVLKPSGKLILQTDNACFIPYYFGGLHARPKTTWWSGDKHYFVFSKEHLENLLRKYGFKIESFNYVPHTYWRKRTYLYHLFFRFFGLDKLAYPRMYVVAVKNNGKRKEDEEKGR